MSRSLNNLLKCPECGGNTKSVDNALNTDNNEMYRQKTCTNPDCRYFFYTVEFVVESNQELVETWNRYRRKKKIEKVE